MTHNVTITPYKIRSQSATSSSFPNGATGPPVYIRYVTETKNPVYQTPSNLATAKPIFPHTNVYDKAVLSKTVSSNQQKFTQPIRRNSGPVPFVAESLPLPCAYLRLPWPPGKPFGRLLPARENNHGNHIYRQYIKRMIVEEICCSPPYYLLRYVQFTRLSSAETDFRGKLSRKIPFMLSQHAFPGLQAISIQQSITALSRHAEMPPNANASQIQVTIQEYVHPTRSSDHIMVVHTALPAWQDLPFNYGIMEAAWVEQVVPFAANILAEAKHCHLVVTYDSAQSNSQWSPNNMRQIITLIAQTVSIALSTMPLYLDTNMLSNCSASHQEKSFLSFQIVIFPSAQFNEGMARIRDTAEPSDRQQSALPHRPRASIVSTQSKSKYNVNPSSSHDDSSFASSTDDFSGSVLEKKRPGSRDKPLTNQQPSAMSVSGISNSLCGVWRSSNHCQKNESRKPPHNRQV